MKEDTSTTMFEAVSPGNGKGNGNGLDFKVTFGEILILVSVIFGLVFQYLNFSVRMGEFEGYTRAKIESIDCELKRINQSVENHISKGK